MEPFKNLFSREIVRQLGASITKYFPSFEENNWKKQTLSRWSSLELKERIARINEKLRQFLPGNYPKAVNILRKASPEFSGLPALIFPEYVGRYGLEHPEVSLQALKEFTLLCSSEGGVRPFILQDPVETMKVMLKWADDKNFHVRRLSSEGCRPRLPWAIGLPDFKKDPSPIVPVLEKLLDDSEEYVRRSVANNLNDICKDHPELALKLGKRWLKENKNRLKLVKHGLRTLLKQGHPGALSLFGTRPDKNLVMKKLSFPQKIKIGNRAAGHLNLENKGKRALTLRLEKKLYFLNKSGKYSEKVFKITEKEMVPGKLEQAFTHDFKDRSIRKHYPGKNFISIILNGIETGKKEITLLKK